MSQELTLHRDINGKPYTMTRNEWGWGVVANESPTDRFHRSYQLYCDKAGEPIRCSCPDCFHKMKTVGLGRNNWCKHMRAVEEENVKPVNHYLTNPGGWTVRYEIQGDRAKVCRSYRGNKIDETELSREEARNHYWERKQKGYYDPEAV